MNTKQLAKAFHRVFDQLTEGMEEAEACDRHWDAGEWSGPAWGAIWEKAEKDAEQYVADRFGVPVSIVHHEVAGYGNYQMHCFYEALNAKSGPTAMGTPHE